MKSKIFFIIIIAASIAIIIGLALSGNDKPPKEASTSAVARNESSVQGQKPQSLAPIDVPEAVVEAKKARMEEAGAAPEQAQTIVADRVDLLKSSADNPSAFTLLEIKDRVTVISLALNMNDEQEVMLASYMEARQSFMRDRETMNFATAIVNGDTRQRSRGIPNLRPEITLDEMTNSVDIMALELKEIKALREKFLSELTKQQKEKFDELPISRIF